MRRALARHPGLSVLADEVCPDWSAAVAQRIAGELLDSRAQGPVGGIDAFVCANDGMAGGVVAALAARGQAGRVLVIGGDGERRAVARIQDGTQHATVFHDPLALARETLRAAVGLARRTLDPERLPRRRPAANPPNRPMPVLDVPFRLVTRQNVSELAAFWAQAGAAGLPANGGEPYFPSPPGWRGAASVSEPG
jgi:ABC-type sugar transport system substrate-binding protein